MLAAKSFNATSDWRALQRWLGILAEELAARMADDAAAHRRHPKTLVLHYRSGHAPGTQFALGLSCGEVHSPGSALLQRTAGQKVQC
jgi:impB/mucB/samB family C-terminal domain